MQRYLINFSYIGTTFRGLQRQVTGILPRQDDPSTVQGCLEMALQRIDAKNMPFIVSSSRTDTGVHALSSSCHVDLEGPNGKPFEPKYVHSSINKFLIRWDIPIRIINVYAVPESFHSRHAAVKRTYLYKLIRINPDVLTPHPLLQHVPIELNDRAWFTTCSEFNENSLREAANLFLGYHDFKTFSAKDTSYQYHGKKKGTRRIITKLSIDESLMNLYSPYSMPTQGSNTKSKYTSYDIYMESSGFLHNQVRRTVGCLVAAAQGKISVRDIKFMLEIPSRQSWDQRIRSAPPYGLYLCQVHYNQSDIETFKEFLQDQDGRV